MPGRRTTYSAQPRDAVPPPRRDQQYVAGLEIERRLPSQPGAALEDPHELVVVEDPVRHPGPAGQHSEPRPLDVGHTHALDADLLDTARAETTAICRGQRGLFDGVTSASPDEDDLSVLHRHLCIHFPRKISPTMLELARHPRLVRVLIDVIGPNVKPHVRPDGMGGCVR